MELLDQAVIWLLCIVLVFFLYGPWQNHSVDSARQRLFALRDDLFDLAANGHIAFENQGYRATRFHLEALIRFAHRLNWPTIGMAMFAMRFKLIQKTKPDLQTLLGEIKDEETKRRVDEIMREASIVTSKLVISRSPIMCVMYGLFRLGAPFVGARKVKGVRRVWNEAVTVASEEADELPNTLKAA